MGINKRGSLRCPISLPSGTPVTCRKNAPVSHYTTLNQSQNALDKTHSRTGRLALSSAPPCSCKPSFHYRLQNAAYPRWNRSDIITIPFPVTAALPPDKADPLLKIARKPNKTASRTYTITWKNHPLPGNRCWYIIPKITRTSVAASLSSEAYIDQNDQL